jgi:hypothetical protein
MVIIPFWLMLIKEIQMTKPTPPIPDALPANKRRAHKPNQQLFHRAIVLALGDKGGDSKAIAAGYSWFADQQAKLAEIERQYIIDKGAVESLIDAVLSPDTLTRLVYDPATGAVTVVEGTK